MKKSDLIKALKAIRDDLEAKDYVEAISKLEMTLDNVVDRPIANSK